MEANKDDPEIDKPIKLPEDATTTAEGGADSSQPMEVDAEGGGTGDGGDGKPKLPPTDPDATENGAWLKAKCTYLVPLEEMLRDQD